MSSPRHNCGGALCGTPASRLDSLVQVDPELIEREKFVAVEVTVGDHGLGDVPVPALGQGGLELGGGDEAIAIRVNPLELLTGTLAESPGVHAGDECVLRPL
ncbi:hypothetical protein GCM10010307_48100 [Streptomyces vastus]|uniref:Uncharacterized protein n=1 Tax=Streptomyces vastus TaxID=285451 RepID=A0ABP6DFN3_9ACTN